MNLAIKILLLGILLTPTPFAFGEIDKSHLGNCDDHNYITGTWLVSDIHGPNNVTLTKFKIGRFTWERSVTYTTTGDDDCIFVESGIIESCEKIDGESFDGDSFLGTIVQNMTLTVRNTKHLFPVPECKEHFYAEGGHTPLPPYSYVETLSMNSREVERSTYGKGYNTTTLYNAITLSIGGQDFKTRKN